MKTFFIRTFALMQGITAATLCVVFFMASGCGKQQTAADYEEPLTSLAGTTWKLAGMVDTLTGEFRELAPFDCEACYTLAFDTDSTAAVINICTRSRLDLSVSAERNIDRMYFWEIYDKDDKDYFETVIFTRALSAIESFSATNKELKLFVDSLFNLMYPYHYVSFIPHKGAGPLTSFRATMWNLEGIVGAKTGEKKEIKPKDMYKLYMLGGSKVNIAFKNIDIPAKLDLNHLDLTKYPFKSWQRAVDDRFLSHYKTFEWFNDFLEGFDFFCSIEYFDSYEISPEELKLYFIENGEKYYLSFKRIIQ